VLHGRKGVKNDSFSSAGHGFSVEIRPAPGDPEQTEDVRWEELAAAHPVIVLEGCDGTGKSTLATLLGTRCGYTIIRSGRLPDGADLAERYGEVLAQPGNLVLDRSFITELVYGPLRADGRSRLTADQSASLAFTVADRGGVLVHLTAHPKALAWRLHQRDGHAPPLTWIRSVVRSYQNVFAGLDGAAPIVRIDTTNPAVIAPQDGSGRRLDGRSLLHGRKGVRNDSISSAWHRFSVQIGVLGAQSNGR
jgi:hypothetical protein